jgi:serine/threonine protein kinase
MEDIIVIYVVSIDYAIPTSKKIVHRDVKTKNMLLDKMRTVKVADFGVARVEASNPSDMSGETGMLGYMAPKVFRFNHPSVPKS